MGTIYAKLCHMHCPGHWQRLSVITVPDSVPLLDGVFSEIFLISQCGNGQQLEQGKTGHELLPILGQGQMTHS